MQYDVFVLGCRNLPVVDFPYENDEVRAALIKEWADGNLFKYSFGFLFASLEPKDFDDYRVPLADVIEGKLVTTKEIIYSVTAGLKRLTFTYDMNEVMVHLDPYYKALGILPYWGESLYYDILAAGKTPRILQGPHKTGSLRPNQKRMVLLDEDRELVFGPLTT
jgi:hypothetical protein